MQTQNPLKANNFLCLITAIAAIANQYDKRFSSSLEKEKHLLFNTEKPKGLLGSQPNTPPCRHRLLIHLGFSKQEVATCSNWSMEVPISKDVLILCILETPPVLSPHPIIEQRLYVALSFWVHCITCPLRPRLLLMSHAWIRDKSILFCHYL